MICNITGKTCDCPICEHCEEPKQEDDGIALTDQSAKAEIKAESEG